MCSFNAKENERGKKEVFYVQLSSSRTYSFHVQRIKSSSRSESELGQSSSHTDREGKRKRNRVRGKGKLSIVYACVRAHELE